MPSSDAIRSRSATALGPSAGYSTVEPASARNSARSSTAICDGPSSPIETPACVPHRRRSALLIAPIRIWSAARARNAPNVAANAFLPIAWSPVWTADHALLGDVHLDEPVGRDRGGVLRIGGVADLTVERDDLGVGCREPRERLAEGLAGRDGRVVGRPRHATRCVDPCGGHVDRRRRRAPDVPLAAELGDRLVETVGGDGLAVPPLLVREERHAVPLLGPRHDQRGTVVGGRIAVRAIDRVDVVSVDLDRVPAERQRAVAEHVGVPAVHRRTALPETVHVEDRGDAARAVERGSLHRLPHRPLGHLGVAQQHPHARRDVVHPHRERHPESGREPLPEGAGRDVDPREPVDRRRVTLQGGTFPPQRQEHLVVERAHRLQGRV